MNDVSKYLAVAFLSSFVWADNHWIEKKTNFEQHIQETNQKKENKIKMKPQHTRYRQKLKSEKSQLKRTFLSRRLQRNSRDKAQKLLNLFTNPMKNHKKNIKGKFIKNRNKNKKLKEKYNIPLEEQLFL